MKSFSIVGYTYNTEEFCPACMGMIIDNGGEQAVLNGEITEDVLRRVADERGIDYLDETSYDSADFPKVIFADMSSWDTRCDSCGEYLIGD